jgi:hypothetical protein
VSARRPGRPVTAPPALPELFGDRVLEEVQFAWREAQKEATLAHLAWSRPLTGPFT